MNAPTGRGEDFAQSWRQRDPLIGFFTRLRDSTAYEILALTPADFIIVDVEHGSFDKAALSNCLFAARSGKLPALVRVCDADLMTIQHAIGAGADGIIIPHVNAARQITPVVEFMRRRAMERAYAGASRISSYRQDDWSTFRERETNRLLIIAQIDEPAGVAAADEILAVKGLHGIFLGQIGLSLALEPSGQSAKDKLLEVCRRATQRDIPIGLSLPDQNEAAQWRREGVSLFAIDSDQNLLRKSAEARAHEFRGLLKSS